MRSLALLGLIALCALPLSAHDHGRHRGPWRGRYMDPRPRVWVASEGRWIDRDRCEGDRWYGDRWDDRPVRWERRDDCDDDRVVIRPLPRPLPPPPGRVQVVLHFGW